MKYLSTAFYVLIGIAVIVFIVWARTPKGKGVLGEWHVAWKLGRNRKGKKYVFNDYYMTDGRNSTQIDHIVVNASGVFVIETKNYAGMIYGSREEKEWTQVLAGGKVKNKLNNPLKQNEAHIGHIKKILPHGTPIFSVVIFPKADISNVKAEEVISLRGVRENFKRKRKLQKKEIEKIYGILVKNRAKIGKRKHLRNIKRIKRDIDNNICPRCGKKLVQRTGPNGTFYGCSGYPKCKFTKNEE